MKPIIKAITIFLEIGTCILASVILKNLDLEDNYYTAAASSISQMELITKHSLNLRLTGVGVIIHDLDYNVSIEIYVSTTRIALYQHVTSASMCRVTVFLISKM